MKYDFVKKTSKCYLLRFFLYELGNKSLNIQKIFDDFIILKYDSHNLFEKGELKSWIGLMVIFQNFCLDIFH